MPSTEVPKTVQVHFKQSIERKLTRKNMATEVDRDLLSRVSHFDDNCVSLPASLVANTPFVFAFT